MVVKVEQKKRVCKKKNKNNTQKWHAKKETHVRRSDKRLDNHVVWYPPKSDINTATTKQLSSLSSTYPLTVTSHHLSLSGLFFPHSSRKMRLEVADLYFRIQAQRSLGNRRCGCCARWHSGSCLGMWTRGGLVMDNDLACVALIWQKRED